MIVSAQRSDMIQRCQMQKWSNSKSTDVKSIVNDIRRFTMLYLSFVMIRPLHMLHNHCAVTTHMWSRNIVGLHQNPRHIPTIKTSFELESCCAEFWWHLCHFVSQRPIGPACCACAHLKALQPGFKLHYFSRKEPASPWLTHCDTIIPSSSFSRGFCISFTRLICKSIMQAQATHAHTHNVYCSGAFWAFLNILIWQDSWAILTLDYRRNWTEDEPRTDSPTTGKEVMV